MYTNLYNYLVLCCIIFVVVMKESLWYIVYLCLSVALLFFSLCFLCGCKTFEKQVSVDREVRVVERDTAVVFVPDSSSVQALLECDSTNEVILSELHSRSGERIVPKVVFKDRVLRVDCKEDSLREVIHIQDSIISTRESVVETQYIRRRNGYDKFVSCGFWILVVVIGVYLYVHIRYSRL